MAWTKRHSRKIFYITAGYIWPYRYIDEFLIRAFHSLGKEVYVYDLRPYPFIAESFCKLSAFDPMLQKGFCQANPPEGILAKIDEIKPDLVFAIHGYCIPKEVLLEIRQRQIPSAVWFMDEPYDLPRTLELGRFFSYVFLQDSSTIAIHRKSGNPNSFFLAHGLDNLKVHIRSNIVEASTVHTPQYQSDILLIGNAFPRRQELLASIKDIDASILLIGKGWKQWETNNIRVIEKIVPFEEAAKYYRAAKINLNIHRIGNESALQEKILARSPNCSLFYIAGCGGFQIVDSSRKDLGKFFEPGEEIIVFENSQDLRKKIEFYMTNEEQRLKIQGRMYERAKREHTYPNRLQEMLELVDSHPCFGITPRFFDVSVVKGKNQKSQVERDWDVQVRGSESAKDISYEFIIIDGENRRIYKNGEMPYLLSWLDDHYFFTHGLNYAVIVSSAKYILLTLDGVTRTARNMNPQVFDYNDEILEDFERKPDLGAVANFSFAIFRKSAVMRTGLFDLKLCSPVAVIKDYLLRLEEQGYGVKAHNIYRIPIDARDRGTFLAKWSPNPRIKVNTASFSRQGKIYLEKRLFFKAEQEFKKALAVEKALFTRISDQRREWENYLYLTLALMHQEKYQEVVHIIGRIVNEEIPEEIRTVFYEYLGRACKGLGKKEGALFCGRRAVRFGKESKRIGND